MSYLRRFEAPSREFGRAKTISDNYAYLPKHLVEVVAFGGAISIILFQLKTGGSLGAVLPILGIYAFAGYRILPAVQMVHSGITRVRFGRPVVRALAEDLRKLTKLPPRLTQADTAMELRDLAFEGVDFRYEGAASPSVTALAFEIPANTTVGIVGDALARRLPWTCSLVC